MYMATERCNYDVTYSGCECAFRKPPSLSSSLSVCFYHRSAFSLNQLTQEVLLIYPYFINIPIAQLLKEGISVPKLSCLDINQHLNSA